MWCNCCLVTVQMEKKHVIWLLKMVKKIQRKSFALERKLFYYKWIFLGHHKIVELLDAAAKNQFSWNGRTNYMRKLCWIKWINRFLFSGQEEQLRTIIESGNNVNARDSDGRTVMHLAATNGMQHIDLKVKSVQSEIIFENSNF